MSLPPALMSIPPAAMIAINPLEHVLNAFNTNPYFIGVMMILLNLGGRFISMEISKEQERVFQHPYVRRALVFTVLFVATRNVFVALIMTVITLMFMSFLFNENSELCIWKTDAHKVAVADGPHPGFTPEETEIWRRLNEKQSRIAAASATQKHDTEENEHEKEKPTPEVQYAMNIRKLWS